MAKISIKDVVKGYCKANGWEGFEDNGYLAVKIHKKVMIETLIQHLEKNYDDFIFLHRDMNINPYTKYGGNSKGPRVLNQVEIESLLGLTSSDPDNMNEKKIEDTSFYHVIFKRKSDATKFKLSFDPDLFQHLNDDVDNIKPLDLTLDKE